MRKESIEDLIEDTVKNKGVLMIPAFAFERTQELLFEINDLNNEVYSITKNTLFVFKLLVKHS